METKKALREFKGKKEGDGFNFMQKEKSDRYKKIAKDKNKKVEERKRQFKISDADALALSGKIAKVFCDKKL